MTNALRKAPQHTAVGFKQTVSGNSRPSAVCSSARILVPFPCVGGQGGLPESSSCKELRHTSLRDVVQSTGSRRHLQLWKLGFRP